MENMKTRPFLKWVGGKWEVGAQLVELLPDPRTVTGVYREPFAGAGAMAYRYAFPAGLRAVLTDTEAALITTYEAVRDEVELLLHVAEGLRVQGGVAVQEARYYELRDRYNALRPDAPRLERAALFLYLHRACFNGLHRVDKRGTFNASYNKAGKPPRFDGARFRACSAVLQAATFEAVDFEIAMGRAEAGDVVYLDPPYDGTWVGYQAGGFSSSKGTDAGGQFDLFTRREERPALLRLQDACIALDARGVRWMLSNADTAEVRRLFSRWSISTVLAPTSISRDVESRGDRLELVIRNY